MNTDTNQEKTPRIDTSIQEAMWLFGAIAAIVLTVFGLGVTASILGA